MPEFACPHHPLERMNGAQPAPDAPARAAGGYAMRITCHRCGASRIEYRESQLMASGPEVYEVGPWGPPTKASYELELYEVRLVVALLGEAWREAMRAVADPLVIDGREVRVCARGTLRRVDDGEYLESTELSAEREVIAAAWVRWRDARDRLDEMERAKAREPVPYWMRPRQGEW